MNLLYEKKSKYTLLETLERVKIELSIIGFGVLWELNFKEKLAEKSLDYDYDYWVLEVCNPIKAQMILKKDAQVGYFLPCKVVVYDSEKGVQVGITRPSEIITFISNNEEIISVANEVETLLITAVNKSIG